MHQRQHGYQPSRELYLMATPCPGCGHVRKYDLWDVHRLCLEVNRPSSRR
jgi:hypothetical protein